MPLLTQNRESGKTAIPDKHISLLDYKPKNRLLLYGFADFICFQARTANLNFLSSAITGNTNFVQIRIKPALGSI
jgi:hypothetical protein